jgi:hypothetical protein
MKKLLRSRATRCSPSTAILLIGCVGATNPYGVYTVTIRVATGNARLPGAARPDVCRDAA